MKYGIIYDRLFKRHWTPAGHPERPERIETIIQTLEDWERHSELVRIDPGRAEEEWILAVHSSDHFERVRATAGKPFHQFDPDTYAGPESFDIAMTAAGSTVRLVQEILKGSIDCGFVLARPPGHHAESNRAMGFCLFNNVAVAAEWAVRRGKLKKVAVVDFDVHHGNGTQEIFYFRPDVLYLSTHQHPFYPGTGHQLELGENEGKGFTVNFPLRAGMGNNFYRNLFRDFVVPILEDYRPELILVSAGYDAHRDDPLAGMNLDIHGYGEIANLLNAAAQNACEGRIAYVLEGGYHLNALSRAVLCTVGAALEKQVFEINENQSGDYTAYHAEMKKVFSPYWQSLR